MQVSRLSPPSPDYGRGARNCEIDAPPLTVNTSESWYPSPNASVLCGGEVQSWTPAFSGVGGKRVAFVRRDIRRQHALGLG